jgi:hypothetical protein
MQQRGNVPAGGLLMEMRLEGQREGDVHKSSADAMGKSKSNGTNDDGSGS